MKMSRKQATALGYKIPALLLVGRAEGLKEHSPTSWGQNTQMLPGF